MGFAQTNWAKGFTFVQDSVPVNPSDADWWFRPSDGAVFVYYVCGWQRIKVDPYNVGYSVGGAFPVADGSGIPIHKIFFAMNGSANAIVTTDIPPYQCASTAVSASLAGYTLGGDFINVTSGGDLTVSTIHKLDFANDANGVQAISTFSDVIVSNSSFNSSLFGYSAGGYQNGILSTISAYNFAAETTQPAGVSAMTTPIHSFAGGYNSSLAGYTTCGVDDNVAVQPSEKLTFANDTGATTVVDMSIVSDLEHIVYQHTAFNSTLKGYITNGPYDFERVVVTFASDDVSYPLDGSWSDFHYASAMNGSLAGYTVGGEATPNSYSNYINTLIFAVDAASAICTAYLSQNITHAAGMDTTDNNGFIFEV